jgi:RimJ/RimL family protein N-acetyltransferase
MRDQLTEIWPLFGIRLATPRLELALPLDEDLVALAQVAVDGIHDPAVMPFTFAWTDAEPEEIRRSSLQYHWNRRGSWKPEEWWLEFAVYLDGRPIGIQGVGARSFATRKAINTGSWLSRRHHGQGLGKEMRAAVLALGFDGLGATTAFTEAFEDNPASTGVTLSLGYRDNGFDIEVPRGTAAVIRRYVLDRDDWEAGRRTDVTMEGVESCLALLGAAG